MVSLSTLFYNTRISIDPAFEISENGVTGKPVESYRRADRRATSRHIPVYADSSNDNEVSQVDAEILTLILE